MREWVEFLNCEKIALWKKAFVLCGCALAAAAVCGQEAREESSVYDDIWRYGVLYDNPGEGFFQRIALSGRLQAEAAWVDADQGDFDDTTWRRFRFGFVTRFAQNWTAQLEADIDLNDPRNEKNESYSGLTDAYIGWSPNEAMQLKVLKQSAGFTLDGATSSKKLLTLQRSNLTENIWFTQEYFTGVTVAGDYSDKGHYKAGVFASDGSEHIGITDASYFLLGSTGYDLSASLDMDEAAVRLDYVYNNKDEDAFTQSLSHVVSLSSQWRNGAWNLRTDLAGGVGYYGQSDLWGLVLMPFYDVSELLQLLARYTYVRSSDDNGVSFNRYEGEVVAGRGDEYHELYTGVNVFFYGHKLKWQTGVQYAIMNDGADDGGKYDGWGLTTGLRIYW